LINAGCYIFRRDVLVDSIPAGEVISVERDTFPELLDKGAVLQGYTDNSYWLDLGTPQAFVRGSCDLVLGRVESSALPGPVGEALLLPGARVAYDAHVDGGTTVGAHAVVENGAYVRRSVIFDEAVIGVSARIANSVIGRGAQIGEGTVLDGVVVGDGARIGAGNELLTGARVFPGAVLGDNAVRFSSDRTS
jgi:mannose-1-phosphate guanylyltransferase